MKKLSVLVLVFAIVTFIGDRQTVQGQEAIKLKMADSVPIGTYVGYQAALYFIKRVGELTKDKVKIEYYPAEQLGKLKDLLNICSSGLADIAYVPPPFYAGHLPLNTVLILPFWTTASEGTEIYNRLLDACPEVKQEFLRYGVRPLLSTTAPQYDIGTVKKPVRSPEDLKGLKLRTAGGTFDKIAKQYGITSVNIPGPEVYEATMRGIVDGNIFSFPSVKGYRISELEKYHTYGARMGGYPMPYQINEKTWQKLPEEIQKALLLAAIDYDRYSGENWEKEALRLVEEFEKGGMVIHRIQAKDRAKWDTPLRGIEEIWIQDMEKRGLPGRKVFTEYKKICGEVVK